MSPFNPRSWFNRRFRQNSPDAKTPEDFDQTFILEPIYTPSGVTDAGDNSDGLNLDPLDDPSDVLTPEDDGGLPDDGETMGDEGEADVEDAETDPGENDPGENDPGENDDISNVGDDIDIDDEYVPDGDIGETIPYAEEDEDLSQTQDSVEDGENSLDGDSDIPNDEGETNNQESTGDETELDDNPEDEINNETETELDDNPEDEINNEIENELDDNPEDDTENLGENENDSDSEENTTDAENEDSENEASENDDSENDDEGDLDEETEEDEEDEDENPLAFDVPEFNRGVFRVGASGDVDVDFLFDGGRYQGEVAFFSLAGFDEMEFESIDDFIATAAQRAASGSKQGHIVISIQNEGARFTGSLFGEPNWNSGPYQGVKTFNMTPGDEFGVMLVPNGRVSDVLDNPSIGGAKRPLFSLATSNPNDEFHLGQIADLTGDGNTFVLEDKRFERSDWDYDDVIFQIRGAVGDAVHVSDVIDPELDWRQDDMGKALLAYTDPYLATSEQLDLAELAAESDGGLDGDDASESSDSTSDSAGPDSQAEELEAAETDTETDSDETEADEDDSDEAQTEADNAESDDAAEASGSTESTESENSSSQESSSSATDSATDDETGTEPQESSSDSEVTASDASETETETGTETENPEGSDGSAEVSETQDESGSQDPVADSDVDRTSDESDPAESDRPATPQPFEFPKQDQTLVGIIDTGFAQDNPDLDYNNLILGQDLVDGDDNPLLAPGEGNEHGTHLLGLIAAQQDNDLGIDGINPDAPIWLGRAVGSGDWASSLVEFVDAAQEAGQPNAVVNLSLDLTEIDAEGNVTPRYELTAQERTALEYARQQGVLVVAAAGNQGGTLSGLAQAAREFDNVLTVGAAEEFDPNVAVAQGHDRADYSNVGAGLGLVAPGGTAENPVVSTVGDDLGTLAGTSVATARVTGATSQVWAANPELSYRQVMEILQTTATDLGSPNWNAETGAGLLNLVAAVHLAKATKPQAYDPSPIEIGENPRWRYIVQPGETPAGIAEEQLGDEAAWSEIRDSEGNPVLGPDEVLPPGTVVDLPVYWGGSVNRGVESPLREPQPLTPANQKPEELRLALNPLYNPGETIRFTGIVADGDGVSDLERVDFWLKQDDEEWVDISDAVEFVENPNNGDWGRFPHELNGLDPGSYQLQATAYDQQGAASETVYQDFTILSLLEGEEFPSSLKIAIAQAMELEAYLPEQLAVTTDWIVSIREGKAESAEAVAEAVGAQNFEVSRQLPNTYEFKFTPDLDVTEVFEHLMAIPEVEFAYPLVPLNIDFLNPEGSEKNTGSTNQKPMWHLEKTGVLQAWEQGFTGKGATIAIIDDGLQHTRNQFKDRYQSDLAWDFTDNDNDSFPLSTIVQNFDREALLANRKVDFDHLGSSISYNLPVSVNGILKEAEIAITLDPENFENYPVDLTSILEEPGDTDFRSDVWWWANPWWNSWWFPGWDKPDQSKSVKLDIETVGEAQTLDVSSQFKEIFPGGNWIFDISESLDTRKYYPSQEALEQESEKLLDNLSLHLTVENPHGTAVASVAAGQKIDGAISGVAYDSNLTALRLIGTNDPLDIERSPNGLTVAKSLYHFELEDGQTQLRNDYVDIFNNSWRPNYFYVPPNPYYALFQGASQGRPSTETGVNLGNIYVVASGNDGHISGDVNYNYLAKSRQTIAVGAIQEQGVQADYSTPGSALMLSAYVGIDALDLNIDHEIYNGSGYNSNRDTLDNFGGTSAAAPQVSGTIALMLEANPNLTARDVQHILIETANRDAVEDQNADWTGSPDDPICHSHQYGFGVVDANAAVTKAQEWKELGKSVGTETDLDSWSSGAIAPWTSLIPKDTGEGEVSASTYTVDKNINLEWVEVDVDIDNHSGNVKIWLESPDGTISDLAETHHNPGEKTRWTYTSVRHWGQSSQGDWTLYMSDSEQENEQPSVLNSWNLNLYGSQAEVSLETRDFNASQDSNSGSFVITRTGDTREPLTVSYDISGDAVNGIDYKELSGTVTFPEGQSQVSLPIVPLYHYNLEGEKTVEINLSPDEDLYKLNPEQAQGVVKIAERTRKSGVPPQIHINPETGNLYFLSEKEMWLGAQAQAEAWGGNLVSIASEAEQLWLEETFGMNEVFHIGFTDSEIYGQTEGDWAWVNGDPVTYENWKPGEPNNWRFLPEGEDFGVMNQHVPGQWNDRTHRGHFSGIIEVDPTTLEQPVLNIRVLEHLAEGENAPGEIAFIRAGDISEDLVVQYKMGGEAENGIDYNELTGTITIPAGEVMATLPIIPITENIQEPGEHIMVRLADGDYDLGTHRVGRVTITEPISAQPWIRQLGSVYREQGYGVAVDTDGNVYVAGVTDGSLDGNVNASGVDANWADPFLTKYDAEGNKLWTRQMGTTGYDYHTDVIVADNGAIYTLGYADGPGTTGYGDGHLSKWDSDGNQIWKKFIGDADHHEFLHNLTEDEYGNIYVAGFKSSNGLVIKYDSDGREIWTNEIDSGSVDRAREIKLDSQGNVYVLGRTEGSLDGNSNSGGSDVFLVKYDSHGNHIWTEQLEAKVEESPGKYNSHRMGLVIDEHDNIYISGYTDGEFPDQTHSGTSDTFVARYDTEGSLVWLRQLGTEEDEVESGLVIDGDGNLNLIGQTRELWGDENHSGGHDYDVYITKLDPDGNLGLTHVLGTDRDDVVRGITSDRNGNIYVSGFTWGAFEGEKAGDTDFWVAKNPTKLSQSYNWDRTYLGENSDTEPHGDEFQVNTHTDGNQSQSSVTNLADGGFVVTWHSEDQDGSGYGVYGQRYDSDGNRVGSEFHINTYTDGDQWYPSVTGLADGSFVVTWDSEEQDGSGRGVYGQRYDSDGNRVGSEFQINTHTNSHQWRPSVTDLADGGFVVTWNSDGQDGSGRGIHGQRYDSDGNRVGSEFQVNTHTHSYQSVPSVTNLADGGFVVTWSSYLQDGSQQGVYCQRYDSNGNVVSSEFQVNTYTDDRQDWPSVTGLSNGGFVVTWWTSREPDGSGYGIYGQRYDSDGNPVGSEFQVNTYTDSNQWEPSVTNLADGGFVVTWQSEGQDGSARSVYGQRYDSDGNRVGFEFKVNTHINNSQWRPSVTDLTDGRFVVTWTSQLQDGSGYGVYGQIFGTDGTTEVTAPTPVTLKVLDGEATQDGNAAVFAVTREENLEQPLQVNYEIAGSAINGVDYQSIRETVTLEPGQQEATISIVPNYNLFNSDNKDFEISLTSGENYEVNGTVTGTVTITNSSVVEHYGSFIYKKPDTGHLYVLTEPDTWYGSQAQAEALGGNLVTVNNQAEQDWLSDTFGDKNNFWTDQGKWNDLNSQESEHFGIAEINPNELDKPIVTMMATDATAGEDGNAGQLVIQRFDDISEDLTVSLSVTGPANPGVDYQRLPEQVTIPAGELLVTVPIFGLPDDIPNNDTFFRVMIGEDENYAIAPLSSAEISILDQHPINRVANEVIGRDVHSLDYWTERWQNGESLEDLRPEIIGFPDNHETVLTELTALYQGLFDREPTSVELDEAQQYLGDGGTLPELRQRLEGLDPEDWIQSPNYVYTNPDTGKRYTFTRLDTWLGAKEQAEAIGGNLVTINSHSENQWLLNKFGQTYDTWIGLNDSPIYNNREGEFTWVSGDSVVYTNWAVPEPNNVQKLSQEGEDFAEMFRNKPWNDMPSNPTFLNLTYRPGIVEFPPVEDPVSGTEDTVDAHFGEDLHTEGDSVRLESYPKTEQARAKFLADLVNSQTVDFEEFEHDSRPQVLDFGETTATLSYTTGDLIVKTLNEGATSPWFPTSGKNYLLSRNHTEFTIEFSKPQSAFGLNMTDAENGPFSMRLHREDGTTKNVIIPVGANHVDFSGSALFFGVKDMEQPFNAVTIHRPTHDGRTGLDELVIGEIK